MNNIDLTSRSAIVTGGARGIGFAIATRLLQSGASVSLWDVDAAALTDAAEKLKPLGKVHIHDLHATILHLLGINHEKLTYNYAGRDFRLTDVEGHVVKDIIA